MDAVNSGLLSLVPVVFSQQPNIGQMLACKKLVSVLSDLAHSCMVLQPLYADMWRMLCWLPTFAAGPTWFMNSLIEVCCAAGSCAR